MQLPIRLDQAAKQLKEQADRAEAVARQADSDVEAAAAYAEYARALRSRAAFLAGESR
jgi:hypothetical protein